ncbi:MAG: YraN family protein [Methylibium sp.]
MSEKRVMAYRHGLFAETVAALLLRLKGHRIVARRYKTPVGEIDLVALKGKRLAFVEVKRRKSLDEAGWSLPTRARRRIVRAAQYWLAGHPDFAGHDLAFDVVLAAPWTWPLECISSLGIPIRPEQSPLTVETLVTLRL